MVMAGNVWEWCNDYYDYAYYKKLSAEGIGKDPKGPTESYDPEEPYAVKRVIRGVRFYAMMAIVRAIG